MQISVVACSSSRSSCPLRRPPCLFLSIAFAAMLSGTPSPFSHPSGEGCEPGTRSTVADGREAQLPAEEAEEPVMEEKERVPMRRQHQKQEQPRLAV